MSKTSDLRLKIVGWSSEFTSVQKCLDHYARKTKSDHTKRNVSEALDHFFIHTLGNKSPYNPDLYVKRKRTEVQEAVQSFSDFKHRQNQSIKYVNATQDYLLTFFSVNGFRNGKSLEVERYHEPARYSKKPQYVPTIKEAWGIEENAGALKYRAAIACIITGGHRQSTIRATLRRDVIEEIRNPALKAIKLSVYPEMKKIDPDACKNSIPYYSFACEKTSDLMRKLAAEIQMIYPNITDDDVFFLGEGMKDGRFAVMSDKSLQRAVKRGARVAGIKRWQDVTPKSLRVVFQNIAKAQFVDGNGRMDEKDQLFLMGHIENGSDDAYFDASKVEYLRSEYLKLKFTDEPDRLTVEDKAKLAKYEDLVKHQETKGEEQSAQIAQLTDDVRHLKRLILVEQQLLPLEQRHFRFHIPKDVAEGTPATEFGVSLKLNNVPARLANLEAE